MKLIQTQKSRKAFCLLLAIVCSSVFAMQIQAKGISFQIIAKTLTINAEKETLKSVLSAIESKSDYVFIYPSSLDLNRKMNIKVTNGSIQDIMNQVVAGTNLTYSVSGKNIYIQEKTANSANSVREVKQVGNIPVKGKIVDVNGDPLVGATVLIKGTTEGTTADFNGNFQINVPNSKSVLVVSYVGYANQEITVGNKKSLSIVLSEDANALEELVVVGYGTQKKVNLSGAVETVTSKSLENRAANNLGRALQGVVPNLLVSQSSGAANGTPAFQIRGESSINGGSPLILVDGVAITGDDFANLNASDIESVSVLKDASSAAIYGARAAYGVILVTTKKGQEGTVKVQFNNSYNLRTITRRPEFEMDPYTVASYRNILGAPWYHFYSDDELEYAKKRSEDPSLPDAIPSTKNPSKYQYLASHNWYDDIIKKVGQSHEHTLSLSGGNDKATYYLGTEYYGETGMFNYNNDDYKRFNVRSRIEFKPRTWLKVGNNTSWTYKTYEAPTALDDSMFSNLTARRTLSPAYNPDGSYTEDGAKVIGLLLEGGDKTTKDSNISTQFDIDIALIKNMLSVKGDFSANIKMNNAAWFRDYRNLSYKDGPDVAPIPVTGNSYSERTNRKTVQTTVNAYLDFHHKFGGHAVSFVGGFNQEFQSSNYQDFYRYDLISPTLSSIQLATGDMSIAESINEYALRSAFYRLNYTYKDKYILETNGRYDGSSKFPKADRFGFFPSFSAAWVVSQEKFFEPVKTVVDHLKLRGSYGSLGNQNVSSNYPYIATMSTSLTSNIINGSQVLGISTPGLVANSLTWEKVYTINGGIDITMFNNRLTMSYDRYRRDTKDMLAPGKTQPAVLGASAPKINAADMKTKGWEFSIAWRDHFNLADKPFNYGARFILSNSRSWITKYDNPTGNLNDWYEGFEVGSIWGLTTLGFFTSEEDVKNHADQTAVASYPGTRPIEAGDLKYADLNGDNKINKGNWTVDDHGDFSIIGNNRPRYQYGLDLNAEWNGFDLRVFFQGIGKRDWYPTSSVNSNNVYRYFGMYSTPGANVMKETMNNWNEQGEDALFPRLKSYLDFYDGHAMDLRIAQTRYLQDASYCRLKNLTLGYSIPKKVINKIKLQNVHLYFSAENLFEITNLSKSYDPEQLNETYYPMQRTYSFGLNITL